jgi:hypothetical protein
VVFIAQTYAICNTNHLVLLILSLLGIGILVLDYVHSPNQNIFPYLSTLTRSYHRLIKAITPAIPLLTLLLVPKCDCCPYPYINTLFIDVCIWSIDGCVLMKLFAGAAISACSQLGFNLIVTTVANTKSRQLHPAWSFACST